MQYAPVASHLGYTQSRKDDLEAVLYMLAFFYFKGLPWEVSKAYQN